MAVAHGGVTRLSQPWGPVTPPGPSRPAGRGGWGLHRAPGARGSAGRAARPGRRPARRWHGRARLGAVVVRAAVPQRACYRQLLGAVVVRAAVAKRARDRQFLGAVVVWASRARVAEVAARPAPVAASGLVPGGVSAQAQAGEQQGREGAGPGPFQGVAVHWRSPTPCG